MDNRIFTVVMIIVIAVILPSSWVLLDLLYSWVKSNQEHKQYIEKEELKNGIIKNKEDKTINIKSFFIKYVFILIVVIIICLFCYFFKLPEEIKNILLLPLS